MFDKIDWLQVWDLENQLTNGCQCFVHYFIFSRDSKNAKIPHTVGSKHLKARYGQPPSSNPNRGSTKRDQKGLNKQDRAAKLVYEHTKDWLLREHVSSCEHSLHRPLAQKNTQIPKRLGCTARTESTVLVRGTWDLFHVQGVRRKPGGIVRLNGDRERERGRAWSPKGKGEPKQQLCQS